MESDVPRRSDVVDVSGAEVKVDGEASSVENETLSDCACSDDPSEVC